MSNTEIVTFDQATALTGKKAIDFFSSEENVKPLVDQVKTEALSLVPNVKTKKGRDEIGSTALKVSKSRKALEDAIDKSVADLKAKVKTATEVKKFVVSELNSAREDVLKPRNEWQAEQDRFEAERVEEIQTRIKNIESLGAFSNDETKEDLASRIDALEAMDVSEGFAEFTAEAATAIASATKKLNDRILQIIEEEKAEAQRKQLEAEQKKNRIQERLTNLVQIPLGLMGKSSTEIQDKINSLQAFAVLEEDFEERTEEAKTSLSQVVSQLDMMLNQAKQLEEAKAQAEEQAKREQEEADRLQRESEEKANQPEPTPEPIQQEEKVCDANISFENGRFKTGGKLPEEGHQGRSQTMRNAEEETEENFDHLKSEAFDALYVAVSKLHTWACALPVGDERTKAFAIYQAARIAPIAEY